MFTDRNERQLENSEYTEEIWLINRANRKGPQIKNDLTMEGHHHRNTDLCHVRNGLTPVGLSLFCVCLCWGRWCNMLTWGCGACREGGEESSLRINKQFLALAEVVGEVNHHNFLTTNPHTWEIIFPISTLHNSYERNRESALCAEGMPLCTQSSAVCNCHWTLRHVAIQHICVDYGSVPSLALPQHLSVVSSRNALERVYLASFSLSHLGLKCCHSW